MLELKFDPFPTLETERLNLRRIDHGDADDIFKLRTDVNVMKHIGKPPPTSLEEIVALIDKIEDGIQNNNSIGWGFCLKGQTSIIGHIGYHRIVKEHYRAEIGYMLLPDHWHKGLMSEAIRAVLDYGFNQMDLHSIEGLVDPTNEKSVGLLTKFNFVKEGHFKENYYFNGKFLDTAVYSLINPG